jgi:sialidase-1
MKMKLTSFIRIVSLATAIIGCRNNNIEKPEQVFISNGEPILLIKNGSNWINSGGSITGSGINNFLVAGKSIDDGDFNIHLRLSLDSLNFSAASFMVGGNHFGFDSRSTLNNGKSALFVEGPVFGKNETIAGTEDIIKPGVPFTADIKKNGTELSFQLNGKEVYSLKLSGKIKGYLVLRPWRNTMKVIDFSASGNLISTEPLEYLFESGTAGYNTFRIPAIITSDKGTILAFAEGRKNSSSDTGDIDLVMKRSEDNGKTWSNLTVLWDDGENVCGNPSPVVDKTTGTLYLLSTWNLGTDHESEIIKQTSKDTRRVYILSSSDEGKTWSVPKEITSSVKPLNWTWYATGPCHGIQLRKGNFKDRLVVPCDHIEAGTNRYYSHVIYSDDHGITWKLGGITPQDQVNECSVAELSDGKLMLNMRNYDRTQKSRKVSLSDDGGLTWGNISSDITLIEPICQGSLLLVPLTSTGVSKLWFLNPADESIRMNMTLRLSTDEGKSWGKSKILYPGPSAYSDLTRVPNGNIGCFYEAGYVTPYQGIVYKEISIADIEK